MTDRNLRQRLEDVYAELQTIEEELPEPLTLLPALRCVGLTVELYHWLQNHGIEDHGDV